MNEIAKSFKLSLENQLDSIAQQIISSSSIPTSDTYETISNTIKQCGEMAKQEYKGLAHNIGITEDELRYIISTAVLKTIVKYKWISGIGW